MVVRQGWLECCGGTVCIACGLIRSPERKPSEDTGSEGKNTNSTIRSFSFRNIVICRRSLPRRSRHRATRDPGCGDRNSSVRDNHSSFLAPIPREIRPAYVESYADQINVKRTRAGTAAMGGYRRAPRIGWVLQVPQGDPHRGGHVDYEVLPVDRH